MNSARVGAAALLLAFALGSSGSGVGAAQAPQDQTPADIAPSALEQINALIAEKESRTGAQQKIDSQLLYEGRMETGQPLANGVWAVETDLPYATDGHVVVDVRARSGSDLASRLPGDGFELVSASADGSDLRVHVNVEQIEMLAADADVLFIQPRQDAIVSGQDQTTNLVAETGQGSRSSEGDVTHLAFAARGAYHVDGTGVKIGVLSDGVTNLAASQARGDLGAVTVLPGQTGSGDEGTAMLEIVHDLAPGAQLYFATALPTISAFAKNIRDLRSAGCDIIVDDVFYFVETPFQDGQAPGVVSTTNGGIVSQAVKDVIADGALYFSSAGNSGNLNAGTAGAWEGDFVDGGATAPVALLTAGRVHNFGRQNFNLLTLANANAPLTLYWSDPLGGSANDYDLFRLNAAGTAVATGSTNIQNGTQDPIEQISQSTANPRIVVVKKNSAQPRFLHLNANRGRLSIATAGTTHGHSTVTGAGAYGIAATPAAAAFPQAFNPGAIVEAFSSDGPRHIFFAANGAPLTAGAGNLLAGGGVVLQKPDVTAADGVSVSGVGGFGSPFFGTSAAAPHAAAIAALVKSANPALGAAEIRGVLTSTAIDIETPGIDRDSGAGILMARAAVGATGIAGTAFLQLENAVLAENPGNHDGVVEPGEGAALSLTLKNYGVLPANGIAASISSPTAGITIAAPGTLSFPDLAPLASVTAAPTLVTIGHDFGCATAAAFDFRAAYGNGGPFGLSFAFPIGARTITRARELDGTTPPDTLGVTGASGVQNFRLNRDGIVSSCTEQKPTPTLAPATAANGGPGARRFDAYTINTCANSGTACATVTLEGADAVNLFTAAYVPSFDPTNIQRNYRGDPGASAASRTYSFTVPGGGSRFAVDVHDVPPNLASPSGIGYTLTVSGVCTGACDPPNTPPIARAKNVTATADAMCVADASIDAGSSDADGDPLTLTQSPAGPYPPGTTSVRLTATDPKGAFSQATGDVTVVDRTGPVVAGLAATPAILPRSHRLVAVTVDFTATDNCGDASCVLGVTSSQARDDDDDEPDVIVVDAHHVRLRADSRHGRDNVYTLTVTCTDGAGNRTIRTTTVVVPHDGDGDGGKGADGGEGGNGGNGGKG
jgi:subtilase family protein